MKYFLATIAALIVIGAFTGSQVCAIIVFSGMIAGGALLLIINNVQKLDRN
jgi:hypothetical protein